MALLVGLLVVVLVVVGTLWRQAEVAREKSEADRREAEAAGLLLLAQLKTSNSLQLAYSMASLEVRDDPETRRFLVRAMWQETPEVRLSEEITDAAFSPDGRWFAAATWDEGVSLWPRDGGNPVLLEDSQECLPRGLDWRFTLWFSPDSDRIGARCRGGALANKMKYELRFWEVPSGSILNTIDRDLIADIGDGLWFLGFGSDKSELVLSTWDNRGGKNVFSRGTLSLEGHGDPVWQRLELPGVLKTYQTTHDMSAVVYSLDGHAIYFSSFDLESRWIGRQEAEITGLAIRSDLQGIASIDSLNRVRLWSISDIGEPVQEFSGGSSEVLASFPEFSPDGSRLIGSGSLWDLTGPPDADPVWLGGGMSWGSRFDPRGRWLALKQPEIRLRPLRLQPSRVLHSTNSEVFGLLFDPDGDRLFTSQLSGLLREWPLTSGADVRGGEILSESETVQGSLVPRFHRLALDREGRFILAGGIMSTQYDPKSQFGATLISLDPDITLRGLAGSESWMTWDVAIDSERRLAAAGGYFPAQIRVWDLESGEMSRFDLDEPPRPRGMVYPSIFSVRFIPDGRLLVSTLAGNLWRLDTNTGEVESLLKGIWNFDLSQDGRYLLNCFEGGVTFHDLQQGTSRTLSSHGETCSAAALDPSGTIAVSAEWSTPGGRRGTVHVGLVTGEAPHLLIGHEHEVYSLAISPDGSQIASAGKDGTIRLWPMPDLSRPALHTLPLDELLTRLRSFTNARVVRDETTAEGYRVEWEPITRWPADPMW